MDENSAGLVVSQQPSAVDWASGFNDSFTAPLTTTNLQSSKIHEDLPEEDDPFGDFNSSTETDQAWQEGFSTNFADMDVKEKNLKKETPASA